MSSKGQQQEPGAQVRGIIISHHMNKGQQQDMEEAGAGLLGKFTSFPRKAHQLPRYRDGGAGAVIRAGTRSASSARATTS